MVPAIEVGGGWPWRSADERRITTAVGVSLFFHGLILFAWHQQPTLRRIVASGDLTVTFRAEVPAQLAPPPAPTVKLESTQVQSVLPVPPESPVLLAPRSDAVIARMEEPRKSRLAPARRPELPATTDNPPAAQTSAAASSPAPRARKALKPGQVAVILEIRADGHPGRIFWDRLPAMTNDKFLRLERTVRARIYATAIPGTAVEEVIDVFALLRETDLTEPTVLPTD